MRPWIMACALALLAGLPIPAQPGPSAVGIDEKLGARVPPDLVLQGEDGAEVRLGSLLGKPTVLTLNYFSCAGICTPLLNGVADVLNQVKAQPGQDFQVLTVSFDPRDTPEIAFQKQANYGREITRPMAAGAWRFLTGPAAATGALCDAVGFRFKAQGGSFIHAGAIMLLSPEGKVTRYIYGTSFQPADLDMAVIEAARGEIRPTVSQWLQFCFSYDPAARGYVFSVTRAAAAATLLLAMGFAVWLAARRKGVRA